MRYFFLLTLSLIAIKCNAQLDTFFGKWKNEDQKEIIYMVFNKDTSMYFIDGKDTTGTSNFKYREVKAKILFSIDTSVRPSSFDLHIVSASGALLSTARGIFEFVGPGKIRMRINLEDDTRPKNFLPVGNSDTFILVKQ